MNIARPSTVLCLLLLVAALIAPTGCHGSSPDSLAAEAAVHFDAGETEAARSLLAEAVAQRPTFAEAWVGLGMAESKLGNDAAAAEAYARALALHEDRYAQTNDPNELVQQIGILALVGKPEEAEARRALGLQRHPDYAGFEQIESLTKPLPPQPE